MAGRPPKPGKVLELTGSAAHDPKRYAARVQAQPIGAPISGYPAHWAGPSSYAVGSREQVWDEYLAHFPEGLLSSEHRELLDSLCIATLEARRTGKAQLRWQSEKLKLLRSIGMTPVDRAKIQLRKVAGSAAEKGSKLTEFKARKKTG